jgi:hypothetical protein
MPTLFRRPQSRSHDWAGFPELSPDLACTVIGHTNLSNTLNFVLIPLISDLFLSSALYQYAESRCTMPILICAFFLSLYILFCYHVTTTFMFRVFQCFDIVQNCFGLHAFILCIRLRAPDSTICNYPDSRQCPAWFSNSYLPRRSEGRFKELVRVVGRIEVCLNGIK